MALNMTGKRVFLRALETRDLEPIWEAYKDLDLELITSGDTPPVSDVQVKDFWGERINNPAPDMRYFVIEPLPGNPGAGQFAGMCNLQEIDMRNRHAELAIWMASRDLRGLGYGQDAMRILIPYGFEVVRLDKIHLGVYEFNEAGMRAYERLGFRYEGRLRHMLYYEGRYWDEWPMRILRREWMVYQRRPAEGFRPYHPDDYDAALSLLQRAAPGISPDPEAARAILRRWWRQIDRDLYGFQVNGALVGLMTVISEAGVSLIQEAIIAEEYRPMIERATLRMVGSEATSGQAESEA